MDEEDQNTIHTDLDHQAAFVFNPNEDSEQQDARPAKRRKVSKKDISAKKNGKQPLKPTVAGFVPLFNGAESPGCVVLREQMFHSAWSSIEDRIQHTLREANRNTLEEVGTFVRTAPAPEDKLPAGYIITGPNTASQQLLFDQLAESLQDVSKPAKVVSIRSAEAPNLKATLKKIIRDATSRTSDDDDELDVSAPGQNGRKYLDYDLEALQAFLKHSGSKRVVVAFQDIEAFDSGLLSDLILLLHSWRTRLQFTLLFGIATSVELFQARLLKSTAQYLYGGQFDVVQASSVLESIVKVGVAHADCAVRVGPKLLRALVERQRGQVVGIQGFISSLKYAYMCHFYANPLSILQLENTEELREVLQPEHLHAVRTLYSFQDTLESLLEEVRNAQHARQLLEDDKHLSEWIGDSGVRLPTESVVKLLRSVIILRSAGLSTQSFLDDFIAAITSGVDGDVYRASVRQLDPEGVVSLATNVLHAISNGDPELGVQGWTDEAVPLVPELERILRDVTALQQKCKAAGTVLRSKYSAQSRVLRTTVVAQKVQLSQDSAQLTEEDNIFTDLIRSLELSLAAATSITNVYAHGSLSESWVYDSRSPDRDVFIPQPGMIVERALARPHDYLDCKCCAGADGDTAATLPATAILYHLYKEAGALVNVADLWSAYYALVREENDEDGLDEREALVRFYQGLVELTTMGFVKQSKKKADHIAKVKWL